MSKTLLAIIVIIAAIAGFWLWNSNKTEEGSLGPTPDAESLPQLPEVSEGDTTVQIQEDLDSVEMGDIDSQFENIDGDLNKL
ncbi:MAG: hypothetical protein HY451_00590 [Parcubacteria group bacterium]|nr:hypothetical protein [Parcubacteria group bacterium]